MTDRDDIKQPQDHLPPVHDRGDEQTPEAPEYPDVGAGEAGSPVSPDTAKEPDKPARHGVAKLPPGNA